MQEGYRCNKILACWFAKSTSINPKQDRKLKFGQCSRKLKSSAERWNQIACIWKQVTQRAFLLKCRINKRSRIFLNTTNLTRPKRGLLQFISILEKFVSAKLDHFFFSKLHSISFDCQYKTPFPYANRALKSIRSRGHKMCRQSLFLIHQV